MSRSLIVSLVALLLAGACSSGAAATKAPTSPPTAPPASAAAAMQVMGKGNLQPVDGAAAGVAELVVLPDGTYEVVLEGFQIDSIAHTNVIMVMNASVAKTTDIDQKKLLDLGPLKSTSGMQAFPIPAAMNAMAGKDYHSVVIWDTQMAHALAAAAIK